MDEQHFHVTADEIRAAGKHIYGGLAGWLFQSVVPPIEKASGEHTALKNYAIRIKQLAAALRQRPMEITWEDATVAAKKMLDELDALVSDQINTTDEVEKQVKLEEKKQAKLLLAPIATVYLLSAARFCSDQSFELNTE